MPLPRVVQSLGPVLVLSAILTACGPSSPPSTPTALKQSAESDVPLAAKTVWAGNYARDIQPIFDQSCISCHGPARAENGLRLDSYENVLKGTQHGAVVVPGSVGTSTLAAVIQGTVDPKIRMPHESRRLTHNRVENILLWIEAGAPRS